MSWEKYVEQTARIRTLSSPAVDAGMNASDYYETLIENFVEIRLLAQSNRQLLKEEILPHLALSEKPLEDTVVEELRSFQSALMDEYQMENLDITMVAMIADRLYADAVKKQNLHDIIEQLDGQVSAYYTLMNQQKRIGGEFVICERSRKKAMDAAYKLLSYLEPEKFAQLPDESSRELVLINSRYMCSLFEGTKNVQMKEQELALLRRALTLEDEPFYRELAPEYDWEYHRVRTLEYFGMLTECGNSKQLTVEESREVWEHCLELKQLWEESEAAKEPLTEAELSLLLYRNEYFAGQIEKNAYQEKLMSLYETRQEDDYSIAGIFHNILVPLEYVLQLSRKHLTEREICYLSGINSNILNYVFGMQNSGSFSYLLEYFAAFMHHFIEIPGQMTFMEACLDGMAALHPPTYVHTIMVGRLAKCFCRHLICLHPEAFIGMLGCVSESDVWEKRLELEERIYRGALCHDFGKIFIMDTIFIYGRDFFDEEFSMVETHPVVGAREAQKHYSTRAYADIAAGHHRWYNNQSGYPDWNTGESQDKLLMDLVACADCLDAATDNVGRSYNHKKTAQEVYGELIAQSGTRYTPYIADLLQDEDTLADVNYLLQEGRREEYYNTYLLLDHVQKSAR